MRRVYADGRCAVYALVDPRTDEVRYIGQTINPRLRRHEHRNDLRRDDYRTRWIRSLRRRGLTPGLVILEWTRDWEEAERFYISYLRWLGVPLVNGTDGGEGLLGRPVSEETRAKQRAAMKGRPPSPAALKAAAKAWGSPELRARMGEKRRGRLRVTHCPRGHEYTPENTYVVTRVYQKQRLCGLVTYTVKRRVCRVCRRVRHTEYSRRRRDRARDCA